MNVEQNDLRPCMFELTNWRHHDGSDSDIGKDPANDSTLTDNEDETFRGYQSQTQCSDKTDW